MSRTLNQAMGDAHEGHLAETLNMRQTRGSGNQWRDQMDAKHDRTRTQYAFAVDGKSTLAKSVSISRDMWAKAVEQAGGERPMLGLRFYDTGALKVHADLVACDLLDFAELLQAAKKLEKILPLVEQLVRERPASARETTLGALARNLGIVDAIQAVLNEEAGA